MERIRLASILLVSVLLIQQVPNDISNSSLSVRNSFLSEDTTNQTSDNNTTEVNKDVSVECFRQGYSMFYDDPVGFCEITNHGNETYVFNASLVEIHPFVHNIDGFSPNPQFNESHLGPNEIFRIHLDGDYLQPSAITYILELNFDFTLLGQNTSAFNITTYFHWIPTMSNCNPTNYTSEANSSIYTPDKFDCYVMANEFLMTTNISVNVYLGDEFIEDDFAFDLHGIHNFNISLRDPSNLSEEDLEAIFVEASFVLRYNNSNYSLGQLRIYPVIQEDMDDEVDNGSWELNLSGAGGCEINPFVAFFCGLGKILDPGPTTHERTETRGNDVSSETSEPEIPLAILMLVIFALSPIIVVLHHATKEENDTDLNPQAPPSVILGDLDEHIEEE